MLSYREIWAVAEMTVQQLGKRAGEAVAEKVDMLALLEDAEGVEMWKAVATMVDMLSNPEAAQRGH